MTSKVVLLPCEDYEENRVYQSINTGIHLLGGWEAIIDKKEKIFFDNMIKIIKQSDSQIERGEGREADEVFKEWEEDKQVMEISAAVIRAVWVMPGR